MGNQIPKCIFCKQSETEDSPILIVLSRGKRNGQQICFNCILDHIDQQRERQNSPSPYVHHPFHVRRLVH